MLVPILNFSYSNEDALQNQDINPKNEQLRSSVLSKKNVLFEIIFGDKRVEYDVLTDKFHSYDSGLNYSGKKMMQFTDENGIDDSGIEIIINPDYAAQVSCWRCAPVVGIIIKGIEEAIKETDCQTAIKACADSGGLPSTKISKGLFVASSCKVTCAQKPKN